MAFRLFLCALCRKQASICSSCDRGQIYCSRACAQIRRRETQKLSVKRYQSSEQGAHNHCLRQRRYRARQRCVTQQGSQATSQVPDSSNTTLCKSQLSEAPTHSNISNCIVCQKNSNEWIRFGFIRRKIIKKRRHTLNPLILPNRKLRHLCAVLHRR